MISHALHALPNPVNGQHPPDRSTPDKSGELGANKRAPVEVAVGVTARVTASLPECTLKL